MSDNRICELCRGIGIVDSRACSNCSVLMATPAGDRPEHGLRLKHKATATLATAFNGGRFDPAKATDNVPVGGRARDAFPA
jgi:hypothetical protein